MKCLVTTAVVAFAVLLSGCATVTATPDGQPKLSSTPNYEQTQDFFIGGLVPEKQVVNTQEVCPNGVRQLQTQTTFVNGLLRVITFNIYAPRTARVWCQS